jgi:hypothetical protein
VAKVHINILLFNFISILSYFFDWCSHSGKARGSGKTRGRGGSPSYSEMELLNLLGIIKRIIPASGEEWDQVEVHHCTLYTVRKAEGLQCKFQELYRKKKLTGDPD